MVTNPGQHNNKGNHQSININHKPTTTDKPAAKTTDSLLQSDHTKNPMLLHE